MAGTRGKLKLPVANNRIRGDAETVAKHAAKLLARCQIWRVHQSQRVIVKLEDFEVSMQTVNFISQLTMPA